MRNEVADSELRLLYGTRGLRQNKAYHPEILGEHIDSKERNAADQRRYK